MERGDAQAYYSLHGTKLVSEPGPLRALRSLHRTIEPPLGLGRCYYGLCGIATR